VRLKACKILQGYHPTTSALPTGQEAVSTHWISQPLLHRAGQWTLNPEPWTLGLLGFNSSNITQRHGLHIERTAEKAFMLSDRVQLSSAEARVEEIKGGSVVCLS
jgi:hypothetical protein